MTYLLIGTVFVLFWTFWLGFFKKSGKLFVTGHDKAIIELKKYPVKVIVKFKGHPHEVPCNHQNDYLNWEIKVKQHHHYSKVTLEIEWNVTNVREIKWTAYY